MLRLSYEIAARDSLANQRIEPMTSSAVMPALGSGVSGALLVTAHPRRWAQHAVDIA
jgi:hypothetical protein